LVNPLHNPSSSALFVQIRLENPHVIRAEQVWVGVLERGPQGHVLNSSYKTRNDVAYKVEMGNTIVNFTRIIPHGILVFFPSYGVLKQCIDFWKTSTGSGASAIQSIQPVHASDWGGDEADGSSRSRAASGGGAMSIWDRICQNKPAVIEPRTSSELPEAIETYRRNLRENNGSSLSHSSFGLV